METRVICCCCVLILLSVRLSDLCVCEHRAPQDLMCSKSRQSSFILKGKTKSPIKSKQGVTKYKLKVLNIFKGESLVTSADQEWLYIDRKLGTCPQGYLLTGDSDVYLMAGYVKNHQLWLGTCPFYYQWRNMTRKVKNGFRGNYLEYCDCKTSDCPHSLYGQDCYLYYSYCAVSNITSMCEWKSNAALRDCLQTAYMHVD